MLIYGQIPSNAMPARSWPSGAKVGGLAVAVESGGGLGDGAYLYEKGRKVGEPVSVPDEFIPVLTILLPITCP